MTGPTRGEMMHPVSRRRNQGIGDLDDHQRDLDGQQRVQSVVVAHQILRELSKAANGLPLSELARSIDMTPPRVLRHLVTLGDLRLVERSGSEPVYRLGIELVRLAQNAAAQHDVIRLALPVMRQLNAASAELVFLAREGDGTAVVWESLESLSVPRLSVPPGMSFSLTGSASGRVLLAFNAPRSSMPLSVTRKPDFPDPIGSAAGLKRRLELIKSQRFDQYGLDGSNSYYTIAAPVLDFSSRAVAAIGMLGFSLQVKGHEKALIDSVKKAAESISRELGAGSD